MTSITLNGNAGVGDRAIFTAGMCNIATPDVTVTSGMNQMTSFAWMAAGTYKLCYQASGNTDSVQQQGVSLTVTAGAGGAGVGGAGVGG